MDQNFSKKYMGSIIFMVALMGITAYFILKDNQIQNIGHVLSHVKPFYIILGIFFMFLSLVFEGMCFHSAFKSLGQKVSFLKNLGYAFIGFYFCSITPASSGGQPSQLYYMKKDGINLSFGSLAVMIITVVNQVVMLIAALVMYILEPAFISGNLSQMYYVLLFSIFANIALISGIIFCIFSRKLVKRFIPWLGSVLFKIHIVKDMQKFSDSALHQIEEYIEAAQYIKKSPAIFFKVMLWMIFQFSSRCFITFFVYKAFGLGHFTLLQVFALQAVLYLAISALPLPGAVGAAESGFVVMFHMLFGPMLVVPAMLLSRGINFYLFLIISGIVTVLIDFNMRHKEKIRKTSTDHRGFDSPGKSGPELNNAQE